MKYEMPWCLGASADVRAITAVLAHLVHVRDRLLLVNDAYIRSATLDDGLRGEPPFLLQGSYRNMAKLASRVVPVMTGDEVEAVLADHYRTEAQTLADAAAWAAWASASVGVFPVPIAQIGS